MASDKKNKIKARLPRGFADRGPAELAATRDMIEKIRAVYERYGFEAVETPTIEYTETLGKFLPDEDRPNEGVFSFQDDDEQWLSLRYDLTAPLARYVAENFDALPKPYRSYRHGWVFRNEKPGPGRFRQFMQFDADTVGAASVAADAEMCMLAADTLEALGVARGDYVIKVNNRKVLDGVMEAVELAGDEHSVRRLIVLRAFDKLDRLGLDGVRQLLGEGRKDESGDFTKGAGLRPAQVSRLIEFIEMALEISKKLAAGQGSAFLNPGNVDQDAFMIPKHGTFYTGSAIDGWNELETIRGLVRRAGYGVDQIRLDPSVIRGLEYYTGPVYEAELTFEVKDEKGRPVRFGSVGGGGRYDGLVGRFRHEPLPATGFSIGVSRLLAALAHLSHVETNTYGPVVITVLDQTRLADYRNLAKLLQKDGIRAEVYLGSAVGPVSRLGPQLKYADKRNSPCAVIQGGDEKAKGEVQIKDLIEGKKAAEAIASNKEWRETRAAQLSVPEGDLVKAVKEVLARHGIN